MAPPLGSTRPRISIVVWVNGVCGIMVKTFLTPSDSMNSASVVTCSCELGWVRMM